MAPITLFTAPTGNGHRVSIMLEETGLAYEVVAIDFSRNEQRGQALLAANPMGQIPAIVDPAGPDGAPVHLGESAAILQYLARKAGRLLPGSEREKLEADRWVAVSAGIQAAATTIFFSRSLGEAEHAGIIAKQYEVIDRYLKTIEARLNEQSYLAGPDYTFVDILAFTLANGTLKIFGIDIGRYPAIAAWRDAIADRPAVQRGLAVGKAG